MYMVILTLNERVTVAEIQNFFMQHNTVEYHINNRRYGVAVEGTREDVETVIEELVNDTIEVERLS